MPGLPTSYFETQTPQGLWRALERDCLDAGQRLRRAHHPAQLEPHRRAHVPPVEDDGEPLTAAGARRARALEPLVEVMQHKGDSECLPARGAHGRALRLREAPLRRLLAGTTCSWLANPPQPASFVRDALLAGPRSRRRSSARTRSATASSRAPTPTSAPPASSTSVGYPGHGGAGAPAPDAAADRPARRPRVQPRRARGALGGGELARRALSPRCGGARPTARAARASSCASSAATASIPTSAGRTDFVADGYADGVPMGGELPTAPRGAVPSLRGLGAARPGDRRASRARRSSASRS